MTGRMNQLLRHLHRSGHREANQTDEELLERFILSREEAAFEALVRRHGPMVLGVCHRVLRNLDDAEDAFQATFLVLVQKAGAVVPRAVVGNWLYGVALQTARRAKVAAAKRQGRERQGNGRPESATTPADAGRSELRAVLDQELGRLPNKYRAPVVLCDLEGKTHKEAAGQLGWPVGTVAGRLARARPLLAKRLTRRGVVLSTASLTAAFSVEAASADVPAALTASTVEAAMLWARTGTSAASSAAVVILTKGVLHSMKLTKLGKLTVLVTLGVAFVTGVGLFVAKAGAPDTPEPKRAATAAALQKPAAEPPAGVGAGGDTVIRVNAADVIRVFATNAALADEKLRGKRVAVSGWVWRVKRIGSKPGGDKEDKVIYWLEMAIDPSGQQIDPKGVLLSTEPMLTFEFTEDDRPALAKLRQGQLVTVEGSPEWHTSTEERGREVIHFFKCKLLAAQQ